MIPDASQGCQITTNITLTQSDMARFVDLSERDYPPQAVYGEREKPSRAHCRGDRKGVRAVGIESKMESSFSQLTRYRIRESWEHVYTGPAVWLRSGIASGGKIRRKPRNRKPAPAPRESKKSIDRVLVQMQNTNSIPHDKTPCVALTPPALISVRYANFSSTGPKSLPFKPKRHPSLQPRSWNIGSRGSGSAPQIWIVRKRGWMDGWMAFSPYRIASGGGGWLVHDARWPLALNVFREWLNPANQHQYQY